MNPLRPIMKLFSPLKVLWRWVFELQKREQQRIRGDIVQVRGLMPLLMKQRNGQAWTAEDRQLMRMHLRSLAKISPYVVLFLMPGGFFLLPILAWWLDRRRNKRLAQKRQRVPDELG